MLANLPAVSAGASTGGLENTPDNQSVSEGSVALPGFGGVLFALLNQQPAGGAAVPDGQEAGPAMPETAEDGNSLPSFLPLAVFLPGQPLAPTHGGSEVEVATELQPRPGPINSGPGALSIALRARFSLGQAGAAGGMPADGEMQIDNADEILLPRFELRPVTPLTQFGNRLELEEGLLSAMARSDSISSTPGTPATANPLPVSGLVNSVFTNPHNPASATVMAPVEVPLQHPAWGQNVAERVQWMVGQNLRQADIQLSPPDLGPLEVRVVVNNDQASVTFTSGHAHVRDALEAALPRLREMFEQQGLNLANADVSQQSFAEQRQAADEQGAGGAGAGNRGMSQPEDTAIETIGAVRRGVGMVDYYA